MKTRIVGPLHYVVWSTAAVAAIVGGLFVGTCLLIIHGADYALKKKDV